MTTAQLKRFITQIQKRQLVLAGERDKLRVLMDEIEGLEESDSRAVDLLGDAIDALSELL